MNLVALIIQHMLSGAERIDETLKTHQRKLALGAQTDKVQEGHARDNHLTRARVKTVNRIEKVENIPLATKLKIQ